MIYVESAILFILMLIQCFQSTWRNFCSSLVLTIRQGERQVGLFTLQMMTLKLSSSCLFTFAQEETELELELRPFPFHCSFHYIIHQSIMLHCVEDAKAYYKYFFLQNIYFSEHRKCKGIKKTIPAVKKIGSI